MKTTTKEANVYWIDEAVQIIANDDNTWSVVYWIDEAVQIIANDDNTWSVTDNGDETSGLDYAEAMRLALEFILTNEDIDAWHNGDGMTPHLANAWRQFPRRLVFQIWGSHDGLEPLSVVVTDEEVPV